MGKGVFHRISLWKHIGVLRMQYRADDESRCRPVKREGPPVSSASSSGRAAKRQKMLEMVEATDDDLLSTLSHEELKKVILQMMIFFRLGHFFFRLVGGTWQKSLIVHVQFCEKVMNMRWET